MTTIAYRDGVIAADRRAYAGSANPIGTTDKIITLFSSDTVMYCGFSTNKVGLKPWLLGYFKLVMLRNQEAIEMYLSNTTTRPQLDFTGLLVQVTKNKDPEVLYLHNSLYPTKVYGEYFAIGTGAQYALGAMSMGANSAKAVEIACKYDVWSGNGIDTYNVRTGE